MILEDKEGNKRYFIPDIESGGDIEVSKETFEGFKRMFDNMHKALFQDTKKVSVPMVFGTNGDLLTEEDKKNLEELFYKPVRQVLW